MSNDLIYQVALSLVPSIGHGHVKILVEKFGTAQSIFNAPLSHLQQIENIGEIRARHIRKFSDWSKAEEEIRFINKFGITPLFLTDDHYPKRLLQCYDSPEILYYKGTADLNARRMVAIIGTRNNSDYGRQLTESLVKDLAIHGVTVVSGLAYGIDAIAHKTALMQGISTIGVLAHGLDQVYPPQHAALAKQMARENGGLLTEFRQGVLPDKFNFPNRNRIVAGMCDATIVIETGIKGGSMITAELANGYNKDVFAFPGKTTDLKSAGCNLLVRTNKAVLITSADDLLEIMGWKDETAGRKPVRQIKLFVNLSREEQIIVDLLGKKEMLHIDELNLHSGLSSSEIAAAMLNLELQGLLVSLPGKVYKLSFEC